MAFEILSSKLYTPFLGSSIYVWTAILTVTLIGLALGYRLGGKYADKNPAKVLSLALLFAACTIGWSSFISAPVLESILSMDVRSASILAGMVIIFLPVTALGMVSPLIVGLLSKQGTPVPMASGLVYGIGTLGGIALLLLTTFYFIPSLGVMRSTFLLSGLLMLAFAIVFISKKEKHA
jgi:predicted membrane-bound spermidine synthase